MARLGVVVAALGVLGATFAAAQSPDEAYGARVAKRDCSQCHAVGEAGDSPNADAPRFRELNRRFDVQDLEPSVIQQLLTHHVGMPQFALSVEELSGLLAYLKSIQSNKLASGGRLGHPYPGAGKGSISGSPVMTG